MMMFKSFFVSGFIFANFFVNPRIYSRKQHIWN